ncbi:MAG: metallophosphoesterase [Bacteroidales bacterium]|nr:metallophosphoesterase [Bacteroidales bacterium]
MKRFLFGASLLLMVAACQTFQPFTFVQMSDTQIGFIDTSPAFTHSDSLMKAAVDAANALDPAYVFVTGDLVNEPNDPVQDSIYRVRLAQVQAPVYVVPGNHDYRGFTREKQAAYIALRGYDRFSIQDKGCAFIGIDSNCIKDGVQEAENEQLAWLEKELSAARKCRYTFVFLHCPVIREKLDEPEDYFNFSMEKRRQYLDLFKQYGVDVVFAGHCHQEWSGEAEGVLFYTAGPVCNALGHGTPGYNVVNVTDEGVEVTYTPTPGIDPTYCRF